MERKEKSILNDSFSYAPNGRIKYAAVGDFARFLFFVSTIFYLLTM